MKKFRIPPVLLLPLGIIFLAELLFSETTCAQETSTLPYDTSYTFAHYKVRRAFYEGLPNGKNEIVFLGNSITENGDWNSPECCWTPKMARSI